VGCVTDEGNHLDVTARSGDKALEESGFWGVSEIERRKGSLREEEGAEDVGSYENHDGSKSGGQDIRQGVRSVGFNNLLQRAARGLRKGG